MLPVDTFEVIVRGRMSTSLVGAMEGFDATCCLNGYTHLVGEVDKEQLHRLFEVLLDLNIELVAVNLVH